jgi:hypothetical protein
VTGLFLKLTLTPLLILAATAAGRRWGHAIGGWLVAMPFTAGPVVYFIALEHGARTAASAALGCLGGAVAESAFALAYSWCATRLAWPVSLLSGAAGFMLVALSLNRLSLRFSLVCAYVIVALIVSLTALPKAPESMNEGAARPSVHLLFRMFIATLVVVILTSSVSLLGPTLSGVLATFPVYASILTVFAHKQQGWGAAVEVLRGLLTGLVGFTGFFCVLVVCLPRVGIGRSLAMAVALLTVLNGGLLILNRRDGQTLQVSG